MGSAAASISHDDYAVQLNLLQVELVKLQRHFIGCGDKILVVVEGRDAAGKDGGIKRIVEYLSTRETRIFALGKPSDREHRDWYFQRYVAQLPIAEEFVLFNRSWYNRAGVEHVSTSARASRPGVLQNASVMRSSRWKSSPIDAVAVKTWRSSSRRTVLPADGWRADVAD